MRLKILLLIVLVGLTGCDQLSKLFSNKSNVEKKISKIDEKVSKMKLMLETHDKIIPEMLYSLGELKMVNNLVEFQKDSKGFSVLKTNLGNFPIALKAITKNVDGYRFTFVLGNPYSFVVHDFEMMTFWITNVNRKPPPQKKTFTIIKDLIPAAWTEVNLDIPSNKDEVQKIVLSFNPKTINFDGDYRKMAQNIEMLKLLQSIR